VSPQISIRHRFKAGKALRAGLSLLFLTGLNRSGTSPAAFTQEAYIWQRDWTPALVQAMAASADSVSGWRVLAAESDGDGHLFSVPVDFDALTGSRLPAILVMRINGRLENQDGERLLAQFALVVDRWRERLPRLGGVEIDYDCATSRLSDYAGFLIGLRAKIGASLPLSITALPTWLSSPRFNALLDATDQVVLQVHAVRDPHRGLIDTRVALRWVQALAQRDRKPFKVALPAYGLRVSWLPDGTVSAVEGETPQLAGRGDTAELTASPAELAKLVDRLKHEALGNLMGIVWFRLPTAADNRAWSLATWRAVITGRPPEEKLTVLARDTATPGVRALTLINRGEADAKLPDAVSLPKDCKAADGVNGYTIEYRSSGLVLGLVDGGLLKAGHVREIGWVRCADGGEDMNVVP
jgi:hypothetical protein